MSTNVSLTVELEAYAREQVESGLYGSMSEFMRSAVRAHKRQNLEYNIELTRLRQELQQAAFEVDSGAISPLDMQDIIDSVDANLKE